MRVVVTGGAGFIGSNLVHALLSSGHAVLVVDDLSTGKPENLDPRSDFRKMDILDPSVPELFSAFKPDAVVHLAAQASVTASIKDPEHDWRINAEGTRAVAAAALAAGARRVISASSAAVYGQPAELPLTETSPTSPINPYGNSKLAAEGLLAETLEGTGVDYASFRFSNVYGPRQDAEGEGGVVAIFLARVGAGLPPVVFGDGKQTRDFIYVGDVVGALVAALSHEGSLADEGPAFNISTGETTSVEQLVSAIRQVAGYFGPVEHEPSREGDIAESVLDPSLAASAFGWRSGVALEAGVARTWRFFAAHR